jgi:tape measure domain-containing protein
MSSRNVDLIIRAKDDASKAFTAINGALTDLAGIQKKVSAGASDMDSSMAKSEGSAKGLAQAITRDTAAAAGKAETAYEKVSAAVDRASTRFDAQKANLRENQAAFNALSAQTDSAAAAIDRMRSKVGPFNDGFEKRLDAAEKQYINLTRQVERTGPALAKQSMQVADAAESLDRVKSAAGGAEAAMTAFAAAQKRIVAGDGVAQQQKLAAEIREVGVVSGQAETEQLKLAQSFRGTAAAASRTSPPVAKVVREILRLGPAADGAARGMIRGARGVTSMRVALAAFYGDSRRSLSLMQRIRGEVLSLTASFVGFYGVFRVGNSFLAAFQEIEAAQNRLGAAFGQNTQKVGAEINFLVGEADRLGFSFGILSDAYSKYLISSQQAGLETEATRKSFTQVIEAARVLKLSNEQVNGVLNAMAQIAGKGTLQMEELRQQLGDRLPGAVGLLAQALGYGSDELAQFYKDVEDGKVGAEEALVALGQGLEDTYGDQLGEALDSTSTKVGQLQNLLFQRQITAANGGFIDGLENALDALNAWLASDDGVAFFESLGAAFGYILDLIPGIIENIDKFVFVLTALASIKIAQVLGGLTASLNTMGTSAFASKRVMVQLNQVVLATSPAMARAMASTTSYGTALRGLRAVMSSLIVTGRALLSAVGGPIGLLVTAVSFFALNSMGSVDAATSAANKTLTEHEEIMQKLQAAYIGAAGDADVFAERLDNLTGEQIEAHILEITRQMNAFRQSADATISGPSLADSRLRSTLISLAAEAGVTREAMLLLNADLQFSEGTISASEYLAKIEELSPALKGVYGPEVIASFQSAAQAQQELEDMLARAEAQLRVHNQTATEADLILLGLADATEAVEEGMSEAAKAAEEFEAKLDEIRARVPELAAEMKRLEEQEALKALLADAIQLALKSGDVASAWERIAVAMGNADTAAAGEGFRSLISGLGGAANKLLEALSLAGQVEFGDFTASGTSAIGDLDLGGTGVEASTNLIKQREGFLDVAEWDVNAFRGGYGSDTITLSDQTVVAITEGMRVSRADGERDLARRIRDEFMPSARNAVGAENFDALASPQQAVLTSMAYNYGEGAWQDDLAAIAASIRNGQDPSFTAGLIRARGRDNNGVNQGRRDQEAAIFASPANSGLLDDAAGETLADEEKAREDAAELAAERAEQASDFHAGQRQSIDNEQHLLDISDLDLVNREVSLALRQAELAAQEAGTALTAEERSEIERITREKYAQAGADEIREKSLEEIRKLEEAVNLLTERRAFLTDKMALQSADGDATGLASTKAELEGVNEQLDEAIAKTLAFWQGLGGEGSAAAIQALQQTQEQLAQTGVTALTTGEQMNLMFAQGAAAAFDRFSERVANGENAIQAFGQEFLRMSAEFLIKIGQMIIQQAILNAISGGTAGGGLGGMVSKGINSLFHGGGVAGQTSQTRSMSPAAMAGAIRYHTGGLAGMAPDEVSAVLKRDEEILTTEDPRHRFNGGASGGGGAQAMPKIINAVDGSDALDHALSTSRGEQILMNWISTNGSTIKSALGE